MSLLVPVEVYFVSELLGTLRTRDHLGLARVLRSLVSQCGSLCLERAAAHITQVRPLCSVTCLQHNVLIVRDHSTVIAVINLFTKRLLTLVSSYLTTFIVTPTC